MKITVKTKDIIAWSLLGVAIFGLYMYSRHQQAKKVQTAISDITNNPVLDMSNQFK